MKYVLITGATSGIGLALARVFARKGFNIVMVSSSEKHLVRARRSINERFENISTEIIVQDLSVAGAAKRVYNKVSEMGIRIDILVNNAGYGLIGSSESIDMDKDEKMLYLNMITPTCLCKLFLKEMYKRGSGKILNIASTASFQPGPYNSTYFASKSYLYSYSRAIRYEAKERGVQVCTLCPGTTGTRFFQKEGINTPIWAMSVGKVAEYAVEGLENNKEVIIPGTWNKIFRIIPSTIKLKIISVMKSKGQEMAG